MPASVFWVRGLGFRFELLVGNALPHGTGRPGVFRSQLPSACITACLPAHELDTEFNDRQFCTSNDLRIQEEHGRTWR
jgi:hypothetical protein